MSFNGHYSIRQRHAAFGTAVRPPASPPGLSATSSALKEGDQTLQQMNEVVKQSRNPAEQNFLDLWARSQSDLRSLNEDLLDGFASITDNSLDSQIAAAILLVRLKLAPVMTIHVPFGGDNHYDISNGTLLAQEVSDAKASLASLSKMFTQLAVPMASATVSRLLG